MTTCKKCKKQIQIGELIADNKCETCVGIRNPYDNPNEYKYLWNGRFVSADEIPSWAKQFYWNLRGIK